MGVKFEVLVIVSWRLWKERECAKDYGEGKGNKIRGKIRNGKGSGESKGSKANVRDERLKGKRKRWG